MSRFIYASGHISSPDRVLLRGAPAAVEALVLASLGVGLAPVPLAAAPLPLRVLHDCVLVLALPLGTSAALMVLAVVLAARTLQLHALLDGAALGRCARRVLAAAAVAILPAVAIVAAAHTSMPYLLLAGSGVFVAGLAALGPGLAGSGRGIAAAAGLVTATGIGISLMAEPALALVLALVAIAVVARWPDGPTASAVEVEAPRRVALRGAGALVVLALLTSGAYVGVATLPATVRGGGRPGAIAAGPVLVVDGFSSPHYPIAPAALGSPTVAFSYAGLAGSLRRPHLPVDTLLGARRAVGLLGAQVAALHDRHGRPVTLVGVSMGALVVRTAVAERALDVDLIAGVVLVDLPDVGSLPTVSAEAWTPPLALQVAAALGEALTPLRIDPRSALAAELSGCVLPSAATPLAVPERRLRSLTDAIVAAPPAPAGVDTTFHAGAHGLSLHLPSSQAVLREAVRAVQAAADAPPADAADAPPADAADAPSALHAARAEDDQALQLVGSFLGHLSAAWRVPAVGDPCAGSR